MKITDRRSQFSRAAVLMLAGLIASVALLVGCSSSTSSSGSSGTPSGASQSLTVEQLKFCKAMTVWGTSVAASNAKAAGANGDVEQVKVAFAAWAPQAQEMVDAVPVDAPANVKVAFQDLNTAIKGTAAGTITKQQQAAMSAASPIVSAYESSVCH